MLLMTSVELQMAINKSIAISATMVGDEWTVH